MATSAPGAVKTKSVNMTCLWAKAMMLGFWVLSAMNFHHAVTMILPQEYHPKNMDGFEK